METTKHANFDRETMPRLKSEIFRQNRVLLLGIWRISFILGSKSQILDLYYILCLARTQFHTPMTNFCVKVWS
jgi:hypothetical protein